MTDAALPIARAGDEPPPAAERGPRRVVEVVLNPRRLWRWQLRLVAALAADAALAPRIVLREDGPGLLPAVALLLRLERMVYGLPDERLCDRVGLGDVMRLAGEPPVGAGALRIDLSGTPLADAPGLRPLYDGGPDEDGLLASLLDGRIPDLALGADLEARPALTDPGVLSRGLDAAFAMMLRLSWRALQGAPHEHPPSACSVRALKAVTHATALRFLTATVAAKARDRLLRLCRDAPVWSIAWRRLGPGEGAAETGRLGSGYQALPQDAGRYYADPFLVVRDGRYHLFCEEYDHALGRGLVSAASFAPGEAPGRPRPVLERPGHLSYPFLIEHEGEVWMIPESSSAGTVDLYRADPFPDRWVHEATLLEGVHAVDATIHVEGGRFWMFCSTASWGGSDWDSLSLYRAPDLRGPWTAHPANPVLMDVGASRPGGAMIRLGGALWRPAQDCSRGYGSALALCRVERLDEEGYAQSTMSRLEPDAFRATGLHTLNRAGDVEVIDLFGAG